MNTFSGLVHTARHTTKVGNTRSRWPNHLEGAVEGGARDWGEVVRKLRPSLVTVSAKLGCLLETPSIRRYCIFCGQKVALSAGFMPKKAVTMRPVRTISREVVGSVSHSSD